MATLDYVVVWPKASVAVRGKRKVLSHGDPLPGSVSDSEAALLASFGAIVPVRPDAEDEDGDEGPQAAAGGSGPELFDPSGHTIPEVLEHVGDDADEAVRVLEAEQARGDAARSTLVKALQAAADGSGPEQS